MALSGENYGTFLQRVPQTLIAVKVLPLGKTNKNKLLFCFSLTYSYLCPSMTQEERTKIEESIVDVIKTVYDPEIPVNIYDLGMIYKIDVQDNGDVDVDMTFTAPNCPAADFILEDVRTKIESVESVNNVNVNLVFEPAWDQSMMSEEARLELGFD